ncbi:uncharacterized protein KNAG_0C03380 [Huiozyma naganishii CBS 8797]|uniref:Amino acid transporter transmembrane domain-containing protein n=1 Tax=Huiozyma naganishii (strain ATCC MYA-139 / BCRC 22969 / CBS 8797 / KCTC 17520 / NBRC 10181 / NCYC 3082 / Yp74L-3) TaxID=1071383 RepID=J7R3P0_HUIN7|nr:hypothetical protein KNAG_0C03380 [Kazachstania naganishii CBS 8797]CCK69445.1 hypothetical protein KNAG_0C03380 [Kazachstania naganishii CBS 8797]
MVFRWPVGSAELALLKTGSVVGILALPSIFQAVGLLYGALLCVACVCTSALAIVLQAQVAEYVPNGCVSFFILAEMVDDRLPVLFDIAMVVRGLGVSTAYLVIVGDLLPQLFPAQCIPARWLCILLVAACLALPLSCIHGLSVLGYSPILSSTLTAVLAVCMPLFYLFGGVSPFDAGTVTRATSNGAPRLLGLPLLMFMFTCHQNIFPTLNCARERGLKHTLRVPLTYLAAYAAVCLICGITGYLTFHKSTRTIPSNVLLLYPQGSILGTLCRVTTLLSVTLSFPLLCHPTRAALNHIWAHWGRGQDSQASQPRYKTDATVDETEWTPLISIEGRRVSVDEMVEEGYTKSLPLRNNPCSTDSACTGGTTASFIAITILLVAVPTCLSVFIDSATLGAVLGLVGITASVTVGYVLPGILGWNLIGIDLAATHWESRRGSTRLIKYADGRSTLAMGKRRISRRCRLRSRDNPLNPGHIRPTYTVHIQPFLSKDLKTRISIVLSGICLRLTRSLIFDLDASDARRVFPLQVGSCLYWWWDTRLCLYVV